jgi:hypothetical protein
VSIARRGAARPGSAREDDSRRASRYASRRILSNAGSVRPENVTMKPVRFPLVLGLLAASFAFAATAAAPAPATPAEDSVSHDGLQRIRVKGLDTVYALPGATLAAYSKVRIDPVDVAFRKDFAPAKASTRLKYGTDELAKIREDVAKLVREEFVKELQQHGYSVVETSGPDVLLVRPRIADLYVNAPDGMQPGRTRTYTMNAGEMTLVGELVDSETGATIARVVDRREARDTGRLTWTNSVTNAAEARTIARSWAKILRTRLDAARGIGK